MSIFTALLQERINNQFTYNSLLEGWKFILLNYFLLQ